MSRAKKGLDGKDVKHATAKQEKKRTKTRVAEDDEINGILMASVNQTYQMANTATEFVESSIIAERIPRPVNGKRMDPEYLVEGLPVWRPKFDHNGADTTHVEKWKALKREKPKFVMEVEKESEEYTSVVVHAMHPRFERWTKGGKTFKKGEAALEAEAQAKREMSKKEPKTAVIEDRTSMMEMVAKKPEDNNRDKVEALKMLNVLLEHLFEDMEPGDGMLQRLRERMLDPSYAVVGANYARKFYDNLALASRRELAEGLLEDLNVSTFGNMTTTLCIMLAPKRCVLKAWADRKIVDGPSKYTTTIDKFVEGYNKENHSSESLSDTRRIFRTLSKLMQNEGGRDMLFAAAPNQVNLPAAKKEEEGGKILQKSVLEQENPPAEDSGSSSGEDEIPANAPHVAPAAEMIEISSAEDDSDEYEDSEEDSNTPGVEPESESESDSESERETEEGLFAKIEMSAKEVIEVGGPSLSKQVMTRGGKRKANAEIGRQERKARRQV